MTNTKALVATGTLAAAALLWTVGTRGAQAAGGGTAINSGHITGVVTGARGPEAGVWVIAETSDLPTKFARIVVTDGQGRYLLPELPSANYDVWVRGYGLVDSPKLNGLIWVTGGGTDVGGNFGSLHNQVFKPTLSCE